jgi:hypothetical protein
MASSASLALSEAAWSFSFALSANTARSHFPSRPEAFYVNKGGTGRAGVSIAQLCEEKLSGKGGGEGERTSCFPYAPTLSAIVRV